MPIIFSTCWYILKAKFEPEIYRQWIHNMLYNVNMYYLVIYTDEASLHYITPYITNKKIKIIIKPLEEFYNYKYKEQWINNHTNNHSIKDKVNWQVNMLWSEKIHFIEETIQKKHFMDVINDAPDMNNEIMYGWCDIGYFRGRKYDMSMDELKFWPKKDKINALARDKIHYGCVNNDSNYVNYIFNLVNNKNEKGLPIIQLPPDLNTIGGGFFILHESKVNWWKELYDKTLNIYFDNGYLVKDDQIIITDCIFSNMTHFVIHSENNEKYDTWFLFQRLLI